MSTRLSAVKSKGLTNGVPMRFLFTVSLVGIIASLLLGGCMPPPVRPAMSQTVITIQRHASRVDARLPMKIYIDGHKSNYTVENGGAVSVPVNDGVHSIYVEVGKIKSEMLNFTAAQRTVSFVATVERGEFMRKKVTLSRSRVIDDTGGMTDKYMQKEFVPEE